MVLGAKMALPGSQSKRQMSLWKIKHFSTKSKHSVLKLMYGMLLIMFGFLIMLIDPVDRITDWFMDIRNGSFVVRMWQKPTYQLYSELWIYNYTNVPQFLSGEDPELQLEEVGPFIFQEKRTNENLTIDFEKGTMTMNPKIELTFLPEKSVAHYKDVNIHVPNVALIAISTLAADKLGYFANLGAYYSINAMGAKLFHTLTGDELLWGHTDPLVTLANNIMPGWIDFSKIGILDRFYAQKHESVEVEFRNKTSKYSIVNWDGSPGLLEQGFVDLNTSTPCNTIRGAYEGLILSPNPSRDTIPIYRRQACRVYPFKFDEEFSGAYGFDVYRYKLSETSFNKSSEYACNCEKNCLPDGFVDVSKCYYGFPIALSKPHFLDADPKQLSYFRGMKPNVSKHISYVEVEPHVGVPIRLESKIQVNIAVRTSPGNKITKPLDGKVMPLVWLSLYCTEPPSEVISLLRLRFVIAPPLIITIEVFLLLIGMVIGGQAFHKIIRPKYTQINTEEAALDNEKLNAKLDSVNTAYGFNEDDLAKQAVSLLAIELDDDELDLIVDKS